MGNQRLNIHKLERQIQEHMAAARVPGLAIGVLHGGELIYARGFGVTSIEDGGIPITPQTLFRIGSTTKALTAAAAMRLVESGRLDLDYPVVEVLPWVRFSHPGAHAGVTVRRLLSHTSGLPTVSDPFGPRDSTAVFERMRDLLPQVEFRAPPGKIYSYSNLGFNLVGLVLAAVTGETFPDLMRRLVFAPLHMARTTFDPLEAMTYPLAQSHNLDAGGGLAVAHRFSENTLEHPSGYAISNILDMANFARMHIAQGMFEAERFLSPGFIAEMHTPQSELFTLDQAAYGLGMQITRYKNLVRVGHNGGLNAYGSRFYMVTDSGTGILLLFNRSHEFSARAEDLCAAVLDDLLDLPPVVDVPQHRPVEPDRSRWSSYCGSYVSNFTGLAEIKVEPGGLLLELNQAPVPLQALRPDFYFGARPDGSLISVGFIGEPGCLAEYAVVQGNACQRFSRPPDYQFTPAALHAKCGVYRGELGIVTVSVDNEQMVFTSQERGQSVPGLPLDNQRVATAWGLAQFLPGKDGDLALKIANYHPMPRQNGAPYDTSA